MNNNNLLITFAAIAIIGLGAGCSKSDTAINSVAESQTPANRIVFEAGAVSAQVTGLLENFDGEQSFVLEVNAGQTMVVEQNNAGDHRITLKIIDPSGEDVTDMDAGCNGSKTISPTVAGDYQIRVWECMKADPWNGIFTLDITVK